TLSFSIRVTTPAKRLRADWATIGRSVAALRRSPINRVTSSIGITRWPPGVRSDWIFPSSAQRRMVSTVTPSISAARPIRMLLSYPCMTRNHTSDCTKSHGMRTNDVGGILPAMDLFPTAAVADAVVRHGGELRVGPPGIVPVIPGAVVGGRALPVRHVGSVDVFLEAIERAGQEALGRVLVVDNDGRTDEACVGDLMALECAEAGIAGIVIWGAHRDTAELRHIGLPVFSLGARPPGPTRLDPRPADVFDRARLGQTDVNATDPVFADEAGL